MDKSSSRLNLYFNDTPESQYALDYFNALKSESTFPNLTETLGQALQEYDTLKKQQQANDELAVMVADGVANKLRPIFLRAGNADKNSRIIIEVLNGMLLQGQYKTIVTTDELVTAPLKKAIGKVDADIEAVIRRNTEKKTDHRSIE